MVMVAIVCLATANVASCNAQGSNRTNSPSSANVPSPSPSPYLGIVRGWKGHVQSIDKNVLVFWVNPASGMSPDSTANNVLRHIEPDLRKSAFQVLVVKVMVSQGIVNKTAGYIYLKADNGTWGLTDDQELTDNIIKAGF